MKSLLIPVLLSALVIPGAGQVYNKEKAKGIILMALFTLVIGGFLISLSVALAAILPPGLVLSPDEAKAFVTQIVNEKGAFIRSFVYLLLAIWGYSIVDAYWGARERARGSEDNRPPA